MDMIYWLAAGISAQVTSKDLHLGVLPFQPAAAAGATSSSAAAAGIPTAESLSEEGLDWKLPVIVLVLFFAAAGSVLQPAVVDIFQLRPLPPPAVPETVIPPASGKGAVNGGSSNAGVSKATVAAAAAVPVPDTDLNSEWASDAEQRSLGVKSRGASMRSRASRRA